MWTADRFARTAIALVAVGMSVYHLTIAFIGAPQAFFFRGIRRSSSVARTCCSR